MNDETKTQIVPDEVVMSKIHLIRGQKVMLDYDLAELYEIENKVLKQAVRRNMERFPPDFLFELTLAEYHSLRSQIVTLEKGRGKHSKYLTLAFSEQGIAMLSSILNSPKAIQMNIAIIRTFVFIRQYALTHKDLTEKLKELEIKYNQQFKDIYEALHYLLQNDKQQQTQSARKRIGYKLPDET
jgi:hypothetical protein